MTPYLAGRRLKVEGFLCRDHVAEESAEALTELEGLLRAGALHYRKHVFHGDVTKYQPPQPSTDPVVTCDTCALPMSQVYDQLSVSDVWDLWVVGDATRVD